MHIKTTRRQYSQKSYCSSCFRRSIFLCIFIHSQEEEEFGLEEEEEEFEVPKKGIPRKEEDNESEYEYEYDESEDEGTAFALRHRPVFIPKVRSIKRDDNSIDRS